MKHHKKHQKRAHSKKHSAHTKKHQKKSWMIGRRGNIFAVFVALLLTIFAYTIMQKSNFLFADITQGGHVPIFSEQGDLGVFLKDAHTVQLQSLKDIDAVESMSILLVFDPEKITLSSELFTSKFPVSYASAGEGNGELILDIQGNLKRGENVLTLSSVEQDMTKIVVGDTVVHFQDGSVESLSVEIRGK